MRRGRQAEENIVQRPFSLKELKHGKQATIRPKEYRAKAVQLEGA
jgi:hypothetical protein